MKYVLGFLVGAFIGAIGRYAVAFSWSLVVWEEADRAAMESLVSAAIGLGVGGAAGATCKPILGSLLGAVLSGSCCLLAWLPLNIGHGTPEIAFTLYWPAVAAMIAVGALAGGIGASVGGREKACTKCGQPSSIWTSDSKGICANCRAAAEKKGGIQT